MEKKISRKHVVEYIETNIQENRNKKTTLENTKYHHNSSYADAPDICKYGILSIQELNKRGIKTFSKKLLKSMKDTNYHINGIEGISLAVVELDKLSHTKNEYYNPFDHRFVDFLVSSEVKAIKNTTHYENEFITKDSIITLDKLKSVDIRLLHLLEKYRKKVRNKEKGKGFMLEIIIDDYNYLREIAINMKKSSLDIPLREMSREIDLDKDKISELPKLILK